MNGTVGSPKPANAAASVNAGAISSCGGRWPKSRDAKLDA